MAISNYRMRIITVLTTCVMLFPFSGFGWEMEKNNPNIIFIFADDMGYGDLNCQNPYSMIPTPNLDHLASQGMRFTDAHTASSVCTPSRYGLLTGRYCWRTRLKSGVLWSWGKPLIEDHRLTIGGMLQKAGYHTACIGKWHLGWDWRTADDKPVDESNCTEIDYTMPIAEGPTTRGFDYYWGDDVISFPPFAYIKNDKLIKVPTVQKTPGDWGTGDGGAMTDDYRIENVLPDLTEKAIEYIHDRAKSERPFFLYFPLNAPHGPIAPSEEFQGSTKAGPYGDLVHQIDAVVGQLIEALEKEGVIDNTLIIFSSDNGSPARSGEGHCGEVGSFIERNGYSPNWPWRGLKADVWEAGHRVPFIVKWAGQVPAGHVSDEPICLTDFMATVADIIGVDLPENAAEDSYSLLPILKGEKLNKPLREAIIHHSGNGLFAVRQGEWKLILGLGAGGFSGKWIKSETGQLYDLKKDPEEKNNVYSKHPELVKKMTALLEQYKETGRSAPVACMNSSTKPDADDDK